MNDVLNCLSSAPLCSSPSFNGWEKIAAPEGEGEGEEADLLIVRAPLVVRGLVRTSVH